MERKEQSGAKRTVIQFVKFNIVGVLNTLVDFLVFQALNLLLGWTYLAQVVGYCCGIVNSYAWNSNWTFRDVRTRSAREITLFLIVNLVSLGVSLGVMWFCRTVLVIDDAWVSCWIPAFLSSFIKGDTVCKLIAMPFAIVVNYAGNRLFVFKESEGAKEG